MLCSRVALATSDMWTFELLVEAFPASSSFLTATLVAGGIVAVLPISVAPSSPLAIAVGGLKFIRCALGCGAGLRFRGGGCNSHVGFGGAVETVGLTPAGKFMGVFARECEKWSSRHGLVRSLHVPLPCQHGRRKRSATRVASQATGWQKERGGERERAKRGWRRRRRRRRRRWRWIVVLKIKTRSQVAGAGSVIGELRCSS